MVYITKEGNGVIRFIVNDSVKKVIIPKEDLVPKQVFDLYHSQLSSFKNRHYAIAKWIVKDIRRMGYEFKQMPMSYGVFIPIKVNELKVNDFPIEANREDKLRFLWNEVERLSALINPVGSI